MILVTGGTGLIGIHLIHDLLVAGQKVRSTYRDESKFAVTKRILQYYSPNKDLFNQIEWVKADILDTASLDDAMQGVDFVYHCAAKVSFNPRHQDELFQTNIEGTANVVNIALSNNIQKLCYVSSTSALGTLSNGKVINENTPWENNTNPSNYSISKHYAEMEVWRGIEEGLDAVIVNPSMIVGPGDWNFGSAAVFRRVWEGLNYYTEGVNGFVDVRDVVKCMINLMETDIKNDRFLIVGENLPFRLFFDHIAVNMHKAKASVKATPMLAQLAWRIEKVRTWITGKEPVITKESARIAVKEEYYSNDKIKAALNIEFTPIKQAIENTCKLFINDVKQHHYS